MGSEPMDFDRWFLDQHGPRPSYLSVESLEMELRRAGEAVHLARERLRGCLEWDARRTSALYAWQIKDKDKR